MRYGFINNFSQFLAADLAAGATTMTLDGGGADLSAASADLVYTLTLDDGEGTTEIVHVTGASGNDLTIERGKEGTTDVAWPVGTSVEMRVTAGVMGDLVPVGASVVEIGQGAAATGARSASVGHGSSASGADSAAYGPASSAGASESTAVGYSASSTALRGTAIGAGAEAHGNYSAVMGRSAKAGAAGGDPSAQGVYASVVGYQATAMDIGGTAVGYKAAAEGEYTAAFGYMSEAHGGWSTASGWQAKTYGSASFAAGYQAVTGSETGDPDVDGYRSLAIGRNAAAKDAPYTLAIGGQALSTAEHSIALGSDAGASVADAIAIGHGAKAASNQASTGMIAIGAGASAELHEGFAIGCDAAATGDNAMALGHNAAAGGFYSVAMGYYASAEADSSAAIGTVWGVTGEYGLAVGSDVVVGDYDTQSGLGSHATCVGSKSFLHGQFSASLGTYNYSTSGANYSVAMGAGAYTTVEAGVRVNGVPYLPAVPEGVETDNELGYDVQATLYDNQPAIARRTSSQVVIEADALDLTDNTAAVTLDLPANTMLFIDAIDVVVTASASPGGSPEIVVGPDDQTPAAYLAATAVGKTAVGGRETHNPLVADGVTSLRVATNTAGTGTTYQAKIVFRGYVMEL